MAEKLKIPGESTTNPSFASPNVQTAADVATSQKIAGTSPTVTDASAPTNQSSTIVPKAPATPSASAASATPTVSSMQNASATIPTSSGAPPGVPATTPAAPPTPTIGLPPTAKSLQGHNAAENDFIQAQNENQMKLYEAALAYNGGPTSALSEAQRAADAGLRASTANRGNAGTIESSLYGNDKSLIATNEAVSDTKAYNTYQEAVNVANSALNKAQIAYARATEQEKREIAEAAERKEQTEAIVKSNEAAARANQQPTYPTPPAQQQAINSGTPAGAGGVVPYESGGQGKGFVRVGKPR